jgi:hypothetical protein
MLVSPRHSFFMGLALCAVLGAPAPAQKVRDSVPSIDV